MTCDKIVYGPHYSAMALLATPLLQSLVKVTDPMQGLDLCEDPWLMGEQVFYVFNSTHSLIPPRKLDVTKAIGEQLNEQGN